MDKDAKIKELELEIARLNGVIQGLQTQVFARPVAPYPMAPTPAYPFSTTPTIFCSSGAQ